MTVVLIISILALVAAGWAVARLGAIPFGMSANLANVWPYPSEIYVAKRTDPATPVAHATNTGWVNAGAYKGTLKFVGDQTVLQLSHGDVGGRKKQGIDAALAQTDGAQITAIEALEASVCDVLLAPLNSTSQDRLKLLAVVPRLVLDGGADGAEIPQLHFIAEGYFSKVSDFFTRTTATWRL